MRINLNIIPLDKSPKDIRVHLEKFVVAYRGTLRDPAKRHDYNLYFQQPDPAAIRSIPGSLATIGQVAR